MTRLVMTGLVFGAAAAAVISSIPARAQNAAINDLKGKIFDATMAQQTFAGGLRHCGELDGNHFYLQPRDRVLNLEEYHRSLDSLVTQRTFNPETKRPWSKEDANARWEQVRKEAVDDKAKCALVASLPEMQKKLEELQRQAATAPK